MHRATRVGRARAPPRPVPWCGLVGDERPACSARRRIEVGQGARSPRRAGRVAFGHAIRAEVKQRKCRRPTGRGLARPRCRSCRASRPRRHDLLLELPLTTMPPTPCPPSTTGFSLPMPRTVRAACGASPPPNASELLPASSRLVCEVESRCTGRAFDVPRRAASVRGRRVRRFARVSEHAAPAHRNNARVRLMTGPWASSVHAVTVQSDVPRIHAQHVHVHVIQPSKTPSALTP